MMTFISFNAILYCTRMRKSKMTIRKCNQCEKLWDNLIDEEGFCHDILIFEDCRSCKVEKLPGGNLTAEHTESLSLEFSDKAIAKLANAICDEMERRERLIDAKQKN